MDGIYVNRVFDTVASDFVYWSTDPAPDLTGAAYPGPGIFGVNTSDYTVVSRSTSSGGGAGTYTLVTKRIKVPADQAMLYYDDIVVEDGGDLLVEGDLTPVKTDDNFSVNFVPAGSRRVVQQNDKMLYTDELTVDGDLVIDGDIEDVTPYDGNDILNALTTIAPNTPAVLGVASPVHFMGPEEFCAVMDIPSNASLAAKLFNLEYVILDAEAELQPEVGKLYGLKGDADLEISGTFNDGDTFAFFSLNASPIEVEIEAEVGGITAGNGLEEEIELTLTTQLYFVRWFAEQGYWRIFGSSSSTTPAPPNPTTLDSSVQTTNVTPTLIASYATVSSGTIITLEFTLLGRDTASEEVYASKVLATVKRTSGDVMSVQDLAFLSEYKEDLTWGSPTITFSGTTILINVTGEDTSTINWNIQGVVLERV